jgi:excisionase family DNA binding protein
MPQVDDSLILRVRDLPGLLGCSELAARRMIERGQLPARRLGRRIIVLRDEVELFLRQLPRHDETVRVADSRDE